MKEGQRPHEYIFIFRIILIYYKLILLELSCQIYYSSYLLDYMPKPRVSTHGNFNCHYGQQRWFDVRRGLNVRDGCLPIK